ncbi:putative uncharacterized protein FLJ44672 [Rhinopithecus roxellana]|uniref:putative uncharacterized protein FLJ44672 n=1 Tax=Rhinopithecus roxellana TaxID=61622 RepID=UPI0012374345|nr:putative uncharacterized protein FLJ44672 [Rhinopithecus roxellana]
MKPESNEKFPEIEVTVEVEPPGPALASAWPPQAKLLPFGGLSRPSSCLSASSPGPELFLVGLSRPTSCHMTTTFGPAPGSLGRPQASLRQAFQAHLQLPGGLERPSSCLTRASPGPALASCRPPQATFVPASQQPRQAQLPPASLSGPRTSSSWPPPAQLLAASQPPLQAQLFSHGCTCRLNSYLQTASFDSTPAQLPAAFVGPKPPPVQLSRPTSYLAVAFPGPALASWQPSPATLLPASLQSQVGLYRPSLCLSYGGLSRPSSSFWLRLHAQLLPQNNLFGLSSHPAPASLCRPKTFSSQAL